MSGNRCVDRSRVRLLLASSSVAALLLGGGAPTAWALAPCAPNSVIGPATVPSVTNTGSHICIWVSNATVTGDVVNNGVLNALTNPPGAPPSTTGITITNNSTIGGAIINNGSITANSGQGILVTNDATVVGGIFNTSTVSAAFSGIVVGGSPFGSGGSVTISTFSGGISNSGTIGTSGNGILVGGVAKGSGTSVTVSAFSGGISNSGTITALSNGILVGGIVASGSSVAISTFSGGITNSGSIAAGSSAGIFVGGRAAGFSSVASATVQTFSGGISNSGTISVVASPGIVVGGIATGSNALVTISTFSGGISNSGMIAAPGGAGIFVGGLAFSGGSVTVSTFLGGITNSGTISAAGRSGILVGGTATSGGNVTISNFAGGISNAGTIRASIGILVGGLAATSGSNVTISNFAGGISNSGTISAPGGVGILVGGGASSGGNVTISNFSGGISNSGTIRARTGIVVGGSASFGFVTISAFSGGISNSGTITARTGILVGGGTASGFGTFVTISNFSGGITNSGTILAARTGILINGSSFAGVAISTFAGGISNSGTISVGASGIGIAVLGVSTFMGGVTNSGTITAGASGAGIVLEATSFFGNVANSGTILGARTGIFVCNCVNFVDGGIVNTGTISAETGILVENLGPVSVFNSGTIVGTGGTAIDFTLASGGNTLTLGPGYSITGNVLGFGNDTFQLGGTGAGTFDLTTIGAAQQYRGFTTFNEVGDATWTLTGTFGQTDPWTVQSGTLIVNGDLSKASMLTIMSGGALQGAGTVGNTQINSGATFTPGVPGVPTSSMTVAGNLAFQSGALYIVTLNPATSSLANVTGTASLAGAVQATLLPGAYTRMAYTLLHSGGLNGATFGSFSDNVPGFTGTLTYTPIDVLLTLDAALGNGGGLNQNQQNVANTINGFFNNGGMLPADFFPIFNLAGGNLANALTLLSGEAATDAQSGAFQLMTEFLTLMLDTSADGRGNAVGGVSTQNFAQEQSVLPPDLALAYASVLKAPKSGTLVDPRSTYWGSAYGGSSHIGGDAAVGSHDATARTFGFAGGVDYHFTPDTTAGFALAGGGTNWGLAQGLGGGRSDAFQAGVYGKTHFGPAYLAGSLAFTDHWMSTDRYGFAGDHLTANFNAQSYGARVEAGYRYGPSLPSTTSGGGLGRGIGVTPYAALQAQSFHTPSYTENDVTLGGFGLGYASRTATDTRTELGARFDGAHMIGTMPLILRARAAWAHDWVSDPSLLAVFQALPGANFVVTGATPAKNSALLSAGGELHVTPQLFVAAKLDGEFGNTVTTYAGTGTVRYVW